MKQNKTVHIVMLALAAAVLLGGCRASPVLEQVIYQVEAGKMHRDGYIFYLSANGVWLTKTVPVPYLRRLER